MNIAVKSGDLSGLRVLFSLCGDRNKASSRVRGYWIAEALERRGVRCTLTQQQTRADYFRLLKQIASHDVVVFQKTYSRWHRLLMAVARRLGKKVLLDLDDAPSPSQNATTLRNVEWMMNRADAVIVGSEQLLKYAGAFQRNVHLIPSSIPLDLYRPGKQRTTDGPVCLGWIGNGKFYQRDLVNILGPPIRNLATKHTVRLKIVGALAQRRLYEAFEGIPNLEVELVDEIEWSNPTAVVGVIQSFDIGLYPLLPNDYNQFKCGFKALEYMAMAKPVVASDAAMNSRIVDHGLNGFLARDEREWASSLCELVTSPELRSQMGQSGRRKVELQFSTARSADALLSVLTDLDSRAA